MYIFEKETNKTNAKVHEQNKSQKREYIYTWSPLHEGGINCSRQVSIPVLHMASTMNSSSQKEDYSSCPEKFS